MILNGNINIQIALNNLTSTTWVQLPGGVLVTSKQAKQEKGEQNNEKAEQREINEKVERAVKRYNEKIRHSDNMILVGRLRKCNAVIYATPDYIILKSYDTIVAFIDKYVIRAVNVKSVIIKAYV